MQTDQHNPTLEPDPDYFTLNSIERAIANTTPETIDKSIKSLINRLDGGLQYFDNMFNKKDNYDDEL